jgi:hypothetical protein
LATTITTNTKVTGDTVTRAEHVVVIVFFVFFVV